MKIGCIGCGNMARAIINGVIRANVVKSENIYCSDKNTQSALPYCESTHIHFCQNNCEVVKNADVLLLCIKPQVFDEVLPQIRGCISSKPVISIAAGKKISFISQHLGKQKIIRVMPNLNAAIGKSESALCANELCSTEDIETAKAIFESIGNVYELREELFSAFSATACCSPAFSFMYIDALAKAGMEKGLDAQIAYRCAAGSVSASAYMLLASDDSPQRLVERVCSPGGSTIEGVTKLRENGFEGLLKEAVSASYNKDKIL